MNRIKMAFLLSMMASLDIAKPQIRPIVFYHGEAERVRRGIKKKRKQRRKYVNFVRLIKERRRAKSWHAVLAQIESEEFERATCNS